MNYKIRTGGLALTAFYAVLFSGSLHIVVALFVYVMSDLKHIFRADAHADLAAEVGIPDNRIFVCDCGDTLVLQNGTISRGDKVECGMVLVDGLSVGDTSEAVLEDRLTLRGQGFAVISAAINMQKALLAGSVLITMRGITGGDDYAVAQEAEKVVTGALKNAIKKGADKKALEKIAKDSLLSILWERIRQRPMVIVNLICI